MNHHVHEYMCIQVNTGLFYHFKYNINTIITIICVLHISKMGNTLQLGFKQ